MTSFSRIRSEARALAESSVNQDVKKLAELVVALTKLCEQTSVTANDALRKAKD